MPSSFWDKIKPTTPMPRVVDLNVISDGEALRLVWSDGRQNSLAARGLRQACPCAACVDEWTSRRTLDVDSVPADVKLKEVLPVGNYALSFSFTDGHGTGIYPFTLLSELSAQP